MEFLIINGEVISKKEANLTALLWNEPFIISQKTWFGYGGMPLLYENIRSIEKQLNTFNLALPELFRNKRELFRITKRMLNKNKFYRSGLINFRFFISEKTIDFVITSLAYTEFDFPFSKNGLLVEYAHLIKSSQLLHERYPCHCRSLWNATQAHISSQGVSSIIFNEHDSVCEGIASNIFLLKDKVLFTPSSDTGCYEDTLRPLILEQAKLSGLETIQSREIKKRHLLDSDEIFFASEEHGIRWILGIENKRFVHSCSALIHERINHYLKTKVEANYKLTAVGPNKIKP